MKKGFTLIELLIVISIIIILLAFVLLNIQAQIARANDAKRKSDLHNINNSFEDYTNDQNTYPEKPAIDNIPCGGPFYTYLKQIPCDPRTGKHYGYFPSASTGGYRVCAILEIKSDPAIAAAGCGGPSGCGLGGGFNYCLASGTSASAVGTVDDVSGEGGGGSGAPPPGLIPGNHWACGKDGICRVYDDPGDPQYDCKASYADKVSCNIGCHDYPWLHCL